MVAGKGIRTKLFPLGNAVRCGVVNFVAVATSSSTGAYSTDGINWTSMTLPSSQSWKSITYGNGKYIAVAAGSATGAYSTDGINWTSMTLPSSQNWWSVTYGDGKFVAITRGSTGAYSTDGINWTSMTLPSSDGWYSVTYGNEKFVICGYLYYEDEELGVRYYCICSAYSTDGINWTMPSTSITTFDTSYELNGENLVYGNNKFVLTLNSAFSSGAYSTDGINWTTTTLPYSEIASVTFGNGKFVAIRSTQAKYGSNKGVYSTDGINWTEMTMPSTQRWYSVCYGNGKFVAISYLNSNVGAYSTDGITWTSMTLPSSQNWKSVCAKTD